MKVLAIERLGVLLTAGVFVGLSAVPSWAQGQKGRGGKDPEQVLTFTFDDIQDDAIVSDGEGPYTHENRQVEVNFLDFGGNFRFNPDRDTPDKKTERRFFLEFPSDGFVDPAPLAGQIVEVGMGSMWITVNRVDATFGSLEEELDEQPAMMFLRFQDQIGNDFSMRCGRKPLCCINEQTTTTDLFVDRTDLPDEVQWNVKAAPLLCHVNQIFDDPSGSGGTYSETITTGDGIPMPFGATIRRVTK